MNVTITAHRWAGGWELHHDGDPVTQSSTLTKASAQVRDYLDTIDPDTDHSDWEITVTPEIGPLATK